MVAVGEVCGHTCYEPPRLLHMAIHLYPPHGYTTPTATLYAIRSCRRRSATVVVVVREMRLKVTLLLVAIATGVSARRSMQAAHGLPQWQPCMAHSPSVQKLCLSPSAGQPNVTWDNSSGTLTCQVPPYGSQFRFRPACVGMCLYLYDLNCRVETPLSVSVLHATTLLARGARARSCTPRPSATRNGRTCYTLDAARRTFPASRRQRALHRSCTRCCQGLCHGTAARSSIASWRNCSATVRCGFWRRACRSPRCLPRPCQAETQPCSTALRHGQSAPLGSMVPQLGSCASSGRACRLRAARHSQGGPRSLGSQPRPQLLELATSKAAHFTAFDRLRRPCGAAD